MTDKSTKHTPGPLIVDSGPEGWDIIAERADGGPCILGTADREEDARLWAAAPNLLEAAKSVLDTLREQAAGGWAVEEPMALLRRAIVRAEGGEGR